MKTIRVPENNKEALKLIQKGKYSFLRYYSDAYFPGIVASYLLEQDEVDHNLAASLEGFFERSLNLIGGAHDPKHDYKGKFAPYGCIPLYNDTFIKLMVYGIKHLGKSPIKFLDAGCGVGDKLLIASMFKEISVHGIENSKLFAGIADSRVRSYGHSVIEIGDITETDYSKYDLIYAYNPMSVTIGMTAFYECVLKTLRPDALCIFVNVITGHEAIRPLMDKTLERHFVPAGIDKMEQNYFFKLEVS